MILSMITGLPTLELEADSECNTYYVHVLITSCKRYGLRGIRMRP